MKKLCLAYLKVWKIIIAHESIKISWQVKEVNIFPKISNKSYCSLLKVLINAASNKNIMNEKKESAVISNGDFYFSSNLSWISKLSIDEFMWDNVGQYGCGVTYLNSTESYLDKSQSLSVKIIREL